MIMMMVFLLFIRFFPSTASPVVFVQSSMVRVMPATLPPPSPQLAASISLAGNEHESFQIALRETSNNATFAVTASPLAATGDATTAATEALPPPKCGPVALMWVSAILGNAQGGPGWWPEIVLDDSRAFAVAGSTTSLWCTAFAPSGTPAGTYRGTVTLTPTSGAAGAAAIVVQVEATVFGFSLPVVPALMTACQNFDFIYTAVCIPLPSYCAAFPACSLPRIALYFYDRPSTSARGP